MSLIKKVDVKNHLSGRHRTEIHLYRPEKEPSAAGAMEERSPGDAPEINDSDKDPLNPPTPSGQQA